MFKNAMDTKDIDWRLMFVEYKRWSNLTKLMQLVVMSLATRYFFPTAIRYPKPNVFFFTSCHACTNSYTYL